MWACEVRCGAAALALCAALQLASAAAAGAPPAERALYKRAEMSAQAVPFVLGSRYGRSPQHAMQPRTERFFMSGRYGKRSEPPDAAPESLESGSTPGASSEERTLSCSFTGVPQLFRCRTAPDPLWDLPDRRNDEVVSEEQ